MSARGNVVCVFIASAICLGIQIAYESTLSPGEPADTTWGSYALVWGKYACLALARLK